MKRIKSHRLLQKQLHSNKQVKQLYSTQWYNSHKQVFVLVESISILGHYKTSFEVIRVEVFVSESCWFALRVRTVFFAEKSFF